MNLVISFWEKLKYVDWMVDSVDSLYNIFSLYVTPQR